MKNNKLIISLIPFLILLTIVVVHSLGYSKMILCNSGVVTCSDFSEAKIFIQDLLSSQSQYSIHARIQAYSNKLYWTTSVGLCLIFGLIALVYSLSAIKRFLYALDNKKSPHLLFSLFILIPLVFTFLVIYLPFGGEQPHTWRILSPHLLSNYFESINWLKPAVDGFSLLVSVYVAIGISVILYSILSKNKINERSLLDHISVFKIILYLGAILLVVNVIRIHSLLTWSNAFLMPEIWAPESEGILFNTYENLGQINNTVVFIQGLMYSLMLLAVYLPTKLLINQRIEGQGYLTDDPKSKSQIGEKTQKAMSFSLGENLGSYVAILGPLLTGPMADLITNLLAGI